MHNNNGRYRLNPFFLGENFKSGLIEMTQYYSISSDCLKEKFYSQSVSFTSFRAKVSGKEKSTWPHFLTNHDLNIRNGRPFVVCMLFFFLMYETFKSNNRLCSGEMKIR